MLKFVGKAIDAIIEPFAPSVVVSRFKHRAQLHHIRAATAAYEGGRIDRRSSDWRPSNASADAQSFPYIPHLIARSRHVINNTALGAAIFHALTRNVVACGIQPSAMAMNESGKERESFNDKVEELFYRWANDARFCDVEGRRNFWQIQDTVLGQMVEAGEIFIHPVLTPNPRGLPGLKLQIIETDQLDDTLVKNTTTGNEIRRGIEINDSGAAVAYHFFDKPTNDVSLGPPTSRRFPAEKIIHIAKFRRGQQTHGVPWLAPVLNKIRDLTEWDANEAFAARTQSSVVMVINQENPDDEINLNNPAGESDVDYNDNSRQFIEPGLVFRSKRPGDQITGFMPTRPSGTYEPFVMAQQQGIAAGMNLSFEEVTRDASRGTYSSNRQTMGVDKRAFEVIQDLLIYNLCNRVWEEFVRASVLERKIPGVTIETFLENEHRYYGVEWSAPGWISVDAQKEVAADVDALKNGITTLKEVYAKRGLHYREALQQMAREEKELTAEGLDRFIPKPDAVVQAEAMEAAAEERPNPKRNGHDRRISV